MVAKRTSGFALLIHLVSETSREAGQHETIAYTLFEKWTVAGQQGGSKIFSRVPTAVDTKRYEKSKLVFNIPFELNKPLCEVLAFRFA